MQQQIILIIFQFRSDLTFDATDRDLFVLISVFICGGRAVMVVGAEDWHGFFLRFIVGNLANWQIK
jgi:hypothetical protein